MKSVTINQTIPSIIFGNTIGAIHLPCFRILNEIMPKIASDNSIISYTILLAYSKKIPAIKICETIAEMANDNYNAIANLIGCKLTDELLCIFKSHLVTFNKARL